MSKPWNKQKYPSGHSKWSQVRNCILPVFFGCPKCTQQSAFYRENGVRNLHSTGFFTWWLTPSPGKYPLPLLPQGASVTACARPQTWHHAIAVLKQVATLGLEANAYTCGAATSACGPLGKTVGDLDDICKEPKECFHVQSSISQKRQTVWLFFQKLLGHCDYCTCWLLRILVSKGVGPDPTISIHLWHLKRFYRCKEAIACGNRRGLQD